MTAKNGHPCTEWFSSLCLQTNRKHIEKQSLICTRKTSFYMDNITSTLTKVVFSINWSWMFALYVHQMCCKLELKTLNNRKTTASLRNHRKRRVYSDPCICTTQRYLFFSSVVLHEIWSIFPWLLDIVVISDVLTRYLIFCTKQTRKQSLFYRQHPERHMTFPQVHSFFRPHGVSLFGNTERCVVVSFSGATSVQWSDVEHAPCTFSGVCLDYFQVFRQSGCAKWKYCEKWHLPAPKIWNPFFILGEYSVKDFITTRQYLVNVTCNCWFRMCTQFHQKLVSYKCMLFVDCLVVLREYFVSWARVTKL